MGVFRGSDDRNYAERIIYGFLIFKVFDYAVGEQIGDLVVIEDRIDKISCVVDEILVFLRILNLADGIDRFDGVLDGNGAIEFADKFRSYEGLLIFRESIKEVFCVVDLVEALFRVFEGQRDSIDLVHCLICRFVVDQYLKILFRKN